MKTVREILNENVLADGIEKAKSILDKLDDDLFTGKPGYGEEVRTVKSSKINGTGALSYDQGFVFGKLYKGDKWFGETFTERFIDHLKEFNITTFCIKTQTGKYVVRTSGYNYPRYVAKVV